jgi:GNAT superfamily N-acetyltransferase
MKIATLEDVPALEKMAANFVNSSPYADLTDVDTIRNLLVTIVSGDPLKGIIVLSPDVGFIVGAATPFLFGKQMLASEVAWWVEEEARGKGEGLKLLEAFEYWGKNVANCKLISMSSLDKVVEKYYKKNGYKLYERAYMKVL